MELRQVRRSSFFIVCALSEPVRQGKSIGCAGCIRRQRVSAEPIRQRGRIGRLRMPGGYSPEQTVVPAQNGETEK